MRRVLSVFLGGVVLALVASPTTTADSAQTADGIRPNASLPPFESSRTYLLSGTRNSAGACHFEYPALTASDARPIIRARDIAIDPIGCNRLVEEGIPTKSDDGRPGLERVEEAIPGRSSNTDSAQVASNATAYHKVWWRDLAFLTVNSDKTSISWYYDGPCAGSGTSVGEWTWFTPTDWKLISKGGSESEQCIRYRGSTNSHFRNRVVCREDVDTWYYYVRLDGFYDGSVYGTRSSDTLNDCLPLFMDFEVKKT